MKKCSICQEFKPTDEFWGNRSSADRLDHRCKSCRKESSKLIREMKKTAPPKPNACQCCGSEDRELVFDHCHDTETFRGWLCQNCNKGFGFFGDTLNDMMKAVGYLMHHKYKLDRGELDDERTGIGYRDGSETQYDLDLRN